MVRSNKVARKRLTESNGTPAMDLGPMCQGNEPAGCEYLATLYKELRLKSIQTQLLEVVDTDLFISNKFEKSIGSWGLGLEVSLQ